VGDGEGSVRGRHGAVRRAGIGQARGGQAKAERIINEELRRLGWQESDLATRRKRDPGKLAIGLRLRKETTLSVKQIAARLGLGTAGSASVCLLAATRQTTSGTAIQGLTWSAFLRSVRRLAAIKFSRPG